MFNTNMFGKNTGGNVNNVTYQRIFNETNTEAVKNAIKTLSWDNILNETNDAEKAYNEFLEMFTESDVYEANFPLRRNNTLQKLTKQKVPG
jgi:hypothetical protein